MIKLVDDKGLEEYPECRQAYQRIQEILKELGDKKAYLEGHKLGAEWLRLENEAEFDKTQKAVDEALAEPEKETALKGIVLGSEAVEMYERLLKTPLYDASCRQWNWSMTPGQIKFNSSRYSIAQLTGVIALASIGRQDEAKKIYEMLTKTELYDNHMMQWNENMSAGQDLEDSDREAYPNLLGIIALASIGQADDARAAYDRLAETNLYDRERKQWNQYMNAKQKLKGNKRESGTHLAGIVALCFIERKEEAEEAYMLLENSVLHDRARRQWNISMTSSQKPDSSGRYADDQLLGIIALCLLDKKQEAKERYAYLTSCPLYEVGRMQWNKYMFASQSVDNEYRLAKDQLIGVAALAALEGIWL